MPIRPATIIQKVAPGPPIETATATPAMLPSPTVPESAVASAWKWETSPASLGFGVVAADQSSACLKARKAMKPK